MDNLKRLNAIIEKDKKINSTYIAKVMKSDFYYLINNYFEVDFNEINIKIDEENGQYNIVFSCAGDRIKLPHKI